MVENDGTQKKKGKNKENIGSININNNVNHFLPYDGIVGLVF